MRSEAENKWNRCYQNADTGAELTPCAVLGQYGYLLPEQGLALDLACGLAGNAFYLAAQKLDVHAVDISQVAIDAVNAKAKALDVPVKGIVRDIEALGLDSQAYDVIVVSYFLNRQLMPDVISHLAPGGLLFYQTWAEEKVAEIGPRNPDFLLKRGELLDFCKSMKIVHYHEESLLGDPDEGIRNQAMIIAQR